MYVYRTSKFNEELKKYQKLSSRVDNLCARLKTINFLEAQDRFGRLHGYLKRKEGNFRLIAKIIKVKKEPIVCFLKVYSRGEPDYRHFLEDVKHQDYLFQESALIPQLSVWLTAQKNQRPKIVNTTLEDNLRIWLQPPDWKINSHGIVIHESELWCRSFSQQEVRNQASVYRQIIEELINKISDNHAIGTKTNWSRIRFYGRDEFYIIYSDLVTKENYSEQVLLLITPLLGVPTQETVNQIIEPLVNHNLELNWWRKRHDLSLDDLITYTKRSYPWYLISDEKFWLRIQDGNGVNLALSTEEKDLLHSVSTQASLPLFLNGRAGSGKSTMLFYLFADYCHRHLQLCRETQQDFLAKPHPLFITYSPNLSDFAKVKVHSILKHHHHFLEETDDLNKAPNLGIFFQSFRGFLLKLLPASERHKFAEDNHVSFHRFRELYGNRDRSLSPEKCWLVIQNFIKGYELISKDIYLESPERYQQIPRKEKTITVEEFIAIRDKVWHWYYKYTQEHHLWDDRDLVRTILDLGCYQPQYTVIFCDEAQDFTRLELQLIMGLSVFSLYNLKQETIFSLPFAFAGDPLQTLNPTGFRWAGFKAAFHDEVLTPLDLPEQSQVRLKLQQLEYNYRSAAAIVKVNNLIQLWRKILFKFNDIEPQKAKKYNNFIPQKFIIGRNITPADLQKTLKDTIIIVPCNEGAEQDFVSHDKFLSLLYPEVKAKNPWNILSAISAKGLEFKQVILYRFGEACTLNLGDFQAPTTEEDKYFLNKLYVAASRATEKLFIVDSVKGETALWSYTSNCKYLDNFLSQIDDPKERQQWQENIDLIILGNSYLNLSNNNVESDALTFETVGIATENINLLERAIAAYQKSQNTLKADFCWAWKLKLERDLLAAGKLFLTLNKITEAGDCFWQATAWDELQQLIINNPNHHQEIASLLVLSPLINFMRQVSIANQQDTVKLSTSNIIEITDFLAKESQENNLIEERDSKPWQVFLEEYCNQLQKLFTTPSVLTKDDWLSIANILINYLETSTIKAKQLVAQCLYFGRDYHHAIRYWEDIDDESTYYYIAKAKITKLPQGLKYLYQGKQYQTMLYLWLKSGLKLEPAWLEYVALAFESIEQYNNALAIYCQLNNIEKVQQCWEHIKDNHLTFKQLKQLVKYYLKQQYWERAITFAQEELKEIKIQCYFIYSLANSKLTSDNLTKEQRQNYQKFIEQYFLNNSQWQQYLNIEYVGIALEKIGSFVTTLAFYEHYVNSSNQQLQQFSRDRWLVTKQKQIDYFRAGVQITKVQKNQQKLIANTRKWNLNLNSIPLQISVPSVNKSLSHHPQPLSSVRKSSFAITGLPTNTKKKALAQGIQQFQFNHLLLRIAESTQQLAIFDLLNHKTVNLDWRRGKIQLETTTLVAAGNQPLSFSDTLGQYQGILWRDVNPRLELKLDNYPEIIKIKFSIL